MVHARAALIAGPTGLVGQSLLRRLLNEAVYQRVIALSRHALDAQPKLAVVDAAYERLEEVLAPVLSKSIEVDVFCCLGTTIRAAGSEAGFRRVDHGYVLALGCWARDHGARRMVTVSAVGADPSSRLLYNRVKGETERDLAALGLRSLVIARPSLLDGKRSEVRIAERLALLATRPWRRLIPARLRPVAADDVAQAMLDAALSDAPLAVLASAEMQGAARRRS